MRISAPQAKTLVHPWCVQAASLGSQAALHILSTTLLTVLQHLQWKASLQEELLAAMDGSRERQKGMDDTLRQIRQ